VGAKYRRMWRKGYTTTRRRRRGVSAMACYEDDVSDQPAAALAWASLRESRRPTKQSPPQTRAHEIASLPPTPSALRRDIDRTTARAATEGRSRVMILLRSLVALPVTSRGILLDRNRVHQTQLESWCQLDEFASIALTLNTKSWVLPEHFGI
jgi:hypothetical protein